MAYLIDKDAVVAEIDRIANEETESIKCFERHKNTSEIQRYNVRMALLEAIRSFLDTLEVKEVDLEREIDNYIQQLEIWEIQEAPLTSMENIAKHFYELGLKAQKGK